MKYFNVSKRLRNKSPSESPKLAFDYLIGLSNQVQRKQQSFSIKKSNKENFWLLNFENQIAELLQIWQKSARRIDHFLSMVPCL